MNSVDKMNELISQLNYYTKLYDEGNPAISDKEWDDLYFQLQEIEHDTGIVLANSPTSHIDYQVINSLKKVQHNHLMLSLDKTKSEEAVVLFLNDKDSIAMAKMDGLTCSIKYLNGKLVSAETRGNGIIGEDITHNIIFVKNVPIEIPIQDELIVDGEIICTYDDFKEFSDEYKNPRNFASGSIRLLDSRVCAQRKLSFIAWDCVKGLDNWTTLSEKLIILNTYGFTFVPYLPLSKDMINTDKIHHSIILIQNWAKDEGYPIDGIVFKYDDCAYYQSLGATEHHFRGGLAFKFYDEEYETILREIQWTMGKTGQLTPVAVFEPVDDGESVITKASLHNLNIMEQLLGAPYQGQKIKVVKQNQIIPQIVWGEKLEGQDYYSVPAYCPICEHPTVIKNDFVYCSNPHCEGKFINQLIHFTGKKGLDIKGLSEATLEKLVEWEWVSNYYDLFTLESHKSEWVKQPGFGEKSVTNLLNTIQDRKTCELWQFISALSIPLVGSTYAKEIAKREKTWEDFRAKIKTNYDFTRWNRFGYEINDALHRFNYKEADELVKKVLYLTNNLWIDPDTPIQASESKIAGKSFCITGSLEHFKNRDELKEFIEKNGGKVVSSVSSKTNYLITNDPNSGSSKNVKAQQLNIPIITEYSLLEML